MNEGLGELRCRRHFLVHLFIYLLAATSIIPQCMVVYTSFRAAKMQVFVDMSPVNDLIVAAEVVEDESEPYGGIAECL